MKLVTPTLAAMAGLMTALLSARAADKASAPSCTGAKDLAREVAKIVEEELRAAGGRK